MVILEMSSDPTVFLIMSARRARPSTRRALSTERLAPSVDSPKPMNHLVFCLARLNQNLIRSSCNSCKLDLRICKLPNTTICYSSYLEVTDQLSASIRSTIGSEAVIFIHLFIFSAYPHDSIWRLQPHFRQMTFKPNNSCLARILDTSMSRIYRVNDPEDSHLYNTAKHAIRIVV